MDKIQLSDQKMTSILTDILLMESYVNEKMPNSGIDSVTLVKKGFYKDILLKHKTDSAAFYTTFNYYQSHPKAFTILLSLVDSSLNNIEPKDTTIVKPLVNVPENLELLSSFKEQENAMKEQYLNNNDSIKKRQTSIKNRIKKNN